MTTPVKPVTVKLDKNRSLRYGMPNLCILEDELGYPLPQLLDEVRSKRISANLMVKLLWAGLLEVEDDGSWKESNLTIPQVANLMNPANLDEYAQQILDAIAATFAKPEKDAKNSSRPEPNKSPGTSKTS